MTRLYRDEAVVLRAQKLGEADRIVTLLTREHGRVRAVAKGVRKTMSRLGGRVEPFMLIDVQLYEGRSLDTVTQVETIGPYGLAIAADYAKYTSATAMLETAERLTETEREPALQQFLLLAGGLRTLADGGHESGLVLDAYLVRSLAVAGWAPSFVDCARCGAQGPHRAFAVGSGGAVCSSCRPPGSAAPHPLTFELLAALLTSDWPRADASELRHRREASGLVAAYLQWHLERRVRSLRWVEREQPRPLPDERQVAEGQWPPDESADQAPDNGRPDDDRWPDDDRRLLGVPADEEEHVIDLDRGLDRAREDVR